MRICQATFTWGAWGYQAWWHILLLSNLMGGAKLIVTPFLCTRVRVCAGKFDSLSSLRGAPLNVVFGCTMTFRRGLRQMDLVLRMPPRSNG